MTTMALSLRESIKRLFIKDNELIIAPNSKVLGGITRQKVIEICNTLQININFRSLGANEIKQTTGCFITGTSPSVLPVKQIDNHIYHEIPDLVRDISAHYETLVEQCIINWRTENEDSSNSK